MHKMEQTWFTVVSEVNNDNPKWMHDAIKDNDYVVIPKDEYDITCEILERRTRQQRDKIKALEILSLENANEFRRQMGEKQQIINHLEQKLQYIKDKHRASYNMLKELQDQYSDLKQRCDGIVDVVSSLRSNLNQDIV